MLDWTDDFCNAVWAGIGTLLIGAVIMAIGFVGWAAYSAAFGAERGIASVYSSREGKWTASGERMNDNALIAAHRTLPFGSRVLVRHGGRSAIVKILDRGPHIRGRIIDLSPAAARAVGINGLGNVEISVLN
jgi:peptidoglycan lytic transglycosylase